MSWDVMLIRTETNAEPLEEIVDTIPFDRRETIERLKTMLPELNTENESCLLLENDLAIEFYMGEEDKCVTVTLMVHGQHEPNELVAAICEEFFCRAYDIGGCKFIDFNEVSSFGAWNEWRSDIVKGYQ